MNSISPSYLLDRAYWAVLILFPLAYATLNFETFKRSGRRYLLYLFILDLSLFVTASLSFLISRSDLIRGNIHLIRTALVAATILRSPLDLFLYSRLLRDVPKSQKAEEA
jgi:hypothetical protein